MRLILTGATGLVGSATLSHILSLPQEQIPRLYILSRSPVPMAENRPNVTVIEHKNFNEYSPELLKELKGADGCIWAQGISQSQVSAEHVLHKIIDIQDFSLIVYREYVKITLDYPLAAAEAFSTLSDSFNFVYVSGEGATQSPGRFTPIFGRVKGECETSLIALAKRYPSLKPYSVRPGYVDPQNDPNVLKHILQRPDQQVMLKKTVRGVLAPVFRAAYAKGVSPTEHLGRFLTGLATGDGKPMEGEGVSGGGWILSNVAFRRLAGL
ncbi:hypothetical protein FE257_007049 [Aspergillus nanangensis]|uniref:Nucleoside-diphosphate-sugar epimerase n=1 Tax=Aspergillus nanangensis TaxID=2582783 RepID=A0AAD4CQ44_ASPNN|nr:hypothetical protein FE257_007049 [Aspergillus nanangensis]